MTYTRFQLAGFDATTQDLVSAAIVRHPLLKRGGGHASGNVMSLLRMLASYQFHASACKAFSSSRVSPQGDMAQKCPRLALKRRALAACFSKDEIYAPDVAWARNVDVMAAGKEWGCP